MFMKLGNTTSGNTLESNFRQSFRISTYFMANKNEKTIPKFCVLHYLSLGNYLHRENKYLNEIEKDSNYIKLTHREVNRVFYNLSSYSKRRHLIW